MRILALTNTYSPHVGGVARSVASFADAFRRRGHRVLVVAPQFDGVAGDEPDVVRVPALSDFHGSGFSLALPIPGLLSDRLRDFQPDLVHSHHPYLLGTTALRIARYRDLPIVFTHHTLYEEYTHYIGADRAGFRQFIAKLATSYANLCDHVFAPSESTAALLRERGVSTGITIVPTGTETHRFAGGDGGEFRRRFSIPQSAFVVGHVGRLAPEKNLEYLTDAVIRYMRADESAHFLVVGDGPSTDTMRSALRKAGLDDRTRFTGIIGPTELPHAYRAMDAFAFASLSETQGMVLVEAMAAGVPVVALDAPGVREVIRDGSNGRMPEDASPGGFADALAWIRHQPPERARVMQRNARSTAEAFSMSRTAALALDQYGRLLRRAEAEPEPTRWDQLTARAQAEWRIIRGMAEAARHSRKAGTREAAEEK